MTYLKDLNEIKRLYSEGANIIEHLKNIDGHQDLSDAIMIGYEVQSGSYTENAIKRPEVHESYTSALANLINKLPSYNSILEAGVGEASTFSKLLPKLHQKNHQAYGFDLSWSRIKYAQRNCNQAALDNVTLFTGNIFSAPIQDNAIDVVYTLHSLESNGGKEKEALIDLYRITNRYLVLLEPIYELASNEAKARMDKLGYVKNLLSTIGELNYKVVEYRLFDYSRNPLNPTGLIVIEKEPAHGDTTKNPLACPVSKYPIVKLKDCLYCEKSLLAYPIIDGIACLLPGNAIVATQFLD